MVRRDSSARVPGATGQHERMDIPSCRNIVDLHSRQAAQLHCSRLEPTALLRDLPRSSFGHNHLQPC